MRESFIAVYNKMIDSVINARHCQWAKTGLGYQIKGRLLVIRSPGESFSTEMES